MNQQEISIIIIEMIDLFDKHNLSLDDGKKICEAVIETIEGEQNEQRSENNIILD